MTQQHDPALIKRACRRAPPKVTEILRRMAADVKSSARALRSQGLAPRDYRHARRGDGSRFTPDMSAMAVQRDLPHPVLTAAQLQRSDEYPHNRKSSNPRFSPASVRFRREEERALVGPAHRTGLSECGPSWWPTRAELNIIVDLKRFRSRVGASAQYTAIRGM
jgi:hypothetical protein